MYIGISAVEPVILYTHHFHLPTVHYRSLSKSSNIQTWSFLQRWVYARPTSTVGRTWRTTLRQFKNNGWPTPFGWVWLFASSPCQTRPIPSLQVGLRSTKKWNRLIVLIEGGVDLRVFLFALKTNLLTSSFLYRQLHRGALLIRP